MHGGGPASRRRDSPAGVLNSVPAVALATHLLQRALVQIGSTSKRFPDASTRTEDAALQVGGISAALPRRSRARLQRLQSPASPRLALDVANDESRGSGAMAGGDGSLIGVVSARSSPSPRQLDNARIGADTATHRAISSAKSA